MPKKKRVDDKRRSYFDQALGYWAATFPAALAEFLLGECPARAVADESVLASRTTTLSSPPEFSFKKRLADKVIVAVYKTRRSCFIHVEFQIGHSIDTPERTVGYMLPFRRILRRPEHQGKTLASFVIHLLEREFHGDPGGFELPAEIGTRLCCSYGVIRLWEEDPRPILERGALELFPLVPLMDGNAEDLLVQSWERIRQAPEGRLSPEEKADLLTVLVVVAELRVRDKGLLERLRSEVRMMPVSEFLTQLVEERTQEVREELLEEGREEGQVAQVRKDLERFLRARFSRVPAALLCRIRKLDDLRKLDALIDRAATAQSIEEFRRHLR